MTTMGEMTKDEINVSLFDECIRLKAEIERLNGLINNPHVEGFANSVCMEAAHQRERWGVEHDAGKTDEEWFWLVGHLASKALSAARFVEDGRLPLAVVEEQRSKALHHIITSAAALANWYAARTGESNIMRPGIDPPKPKIPVSKDALREVLSALVGPSHHIRELQATRGEVYQLAAGRENPIDVVLREYNTWAEEQNALKAQATNPS